MDKIADIAQRVKTQITQPLSKTTTKPSPSGITQNPSTTCDICDGLGFFVPDVDRYDPKFGRAQKCPHGCGTLGERERAAASGLLGNMRKLSFVTSKGWGQSVRPAATAVKQAVTADPPAGFILISGPYGCGKTHILAAAVNEAIERGGVGLFSTADGILDRFRETFDKETKSGNADTYWQVWNRFLDVPVLCVDELDRVSGTAWAENQLFQVLNKRYEKSVYGNDNGRTCLTVLATNSAVEGLPPYLISRLKDGRTGQIFEIEKSVDVRQVLEVSK